MASSSATWRQASEEISLPPSLRNSGRGTVFLNDCITKKWLQVLEKDIPGS